MDLRVTQQGMVEQALSNTRTQTVRLAQLQEQALSGKRLQAPSDDPLASLTLLDFKAQDARLAAHLDGLNTARGDLNASVGSLQEVTGLLSRARQIALEANSAATDSRAAETLAREVERILDRLLENANARHGGRYLFGGTADQSEPFARTASGVNYVGSADPVQANVAQSVTVSTRYAGSEVFLQRDRATTVYLGSTGAQAGTGTDSAFGQAALQVRHTSTSYAGGSGIQPGTSSAASDTILGPVGAHQLAIADTSGTGAFGTVSLNGGPAIAFTNSDTNLELRGPDGELVFVDSTAITAGFNGAVNITSDGTLSVDGGASSVAINFSGNQVVADSASGAITNVDTSAVRRTGDEHLEYTGTADAFQALAELRDDLSNARGLSDHERSQALARRITDLERVRTGILNVIGDQSVTLENLDGMEVRMQDIQVNLRGLTSEIEDTDLAEVVIRLQEQQNLLQLTLATTARIFSPSLLDFLS
jgi:flagellar hook-associated protein 3